MKTVTTQFCDMWHKQGHVCKVVSYIPVSSLRCALFHLVRLGQTALCRYIYMKYNGIEIIEKDFYYIYKRHFFFHFDISSFGFHAINFYDIKFLEYNIKQQLTLNIEKNYISDACETKTQSSG